MDANKGIEDKGDSTPLETATNNNFGTGVSLLIFAGADVNRKLSNGVPVWWLAMTDAQGEKFDINILKLLIKCGASLTTTFSKAITPHAFAKSQKIRNSRGF